MVNQVLKLIFSLLTLLNYSKGGQIFLVFCSHKHIIGTFCRSFTIPIALHIVEGIAFFFFPPLAFFRLVIVFQRLTQLEPSKALSITASNCHPQILPLYFKYIYK